MHMLLTLFICGRSRAADPTSSSARRPPIIEDVIIIYCFLLICYIEMYSLILGW